MVAYLHREKNWQSPVAWEGIYSLKKDRERGGGGGEREREGVERSEGNLINMGRCF